MYKIIIVNEDNNRVNNVINNNITIDSETLDILCSNSNILTSHNTELYIAVKCEDCGELIEVTNATEYEGSIYCNNCMTTCEYCGEMVPTIKTTDTQEGRVCNDCLKDSFVKCDYCGEYFLEDNAVSVYNRRGNELIYCPDCVDMHAEKCEYCGEYFVYDCMTMTEDGEVCEGCLNEEYVYCERCDTYVRLDNYNYDCDMCCNCAEEYSAIREYHKNPLKHFFGGIKEGVFVGGGIELEVGGKEDFDYRIAEQLTSRLNELVDSDNNELYYMKDSSIDRGFEIITQPHTLDSLLSMRWKEILDTIKDEGYTSHDNGTCGLHMHLSRRFFGSTTDKQDRAVAKLIYFYQHFWEDCVKISRRKTDDNNNVCYAYNWNSGVDNAYTKEGAIKLAKKKGWIADRYHAVNTENDYTIEHRLMRGTLNYNTFMATLDFIITISRNAKYIKWSDTDNASKWLKGLKPETVEYIKSRKAFEEVL